MIVANTKSLIWSEQPLLKFMRIIFAHPQQQQISPNGGTERKIIVYLHLICRCIAWLITLSLHGCNLFIFINMDIVYFKFFKSGATYAWILLIRYISKAVHSFAIHTVMLFLLPKHWQMLLDSLVKTENNFTFKPTHFYSTVWKVCIAGVLYIILSVRLKLGNK